MSDKPISVGDLVMVVRGLPCCGKETGAEGGVFEVTDVSLKEDLCHACGGILPPPAYYGYPGRQAITGTRLKRIDPPPEAISEDARKPVEETA